MFNLVAISTKSMLCSYSDSAVNFIQFICLLVVECFKIKTYFFVVCSRVSWHHFRVHDFKFVTYFLWKVNCTTFFCDEMECITADRYMKPQHIKPALSLSLT